MSLQCINPTYSGSATLESENEGVLHTYRGVSSPEPSSISIISSTESDISELLTTKWTPIVGFRYPTNTHGLDRRYNERSEIK